MNLAESRPNLHLHGWLLALGGISILGQVVLLRELLVASFGSELIYLLAFGFLLLANAFGVLAGGRGAESADSQIRGLFLGLAVLVPMLTAGVRGLHLLFGGVPGAYLPFLHQLLGMALVLFPFGLIAGLLFQRIAALYIRAGGTLSAAYAIESMGGLVGGALATLFLAVGVQNLAAGFGTGLAAALAATLPWCSLRTAWGRAGAGVSLLLLVLLGYSASLDRWLTSLNHPGLVVTRDTPYGRVSAREAVGQIAVFADNALVFESQGTEAEEFVHLAALQVEAPRRILILGGGSEGLIGKALAHGPEEVDDVELDRALLAALSPYLPAGIQTSWRDSRVRLAIADPRQFLGQAGQYDLILVSMGEPTSGQANRFYTREFFATCQQHLAPKGVLAFRLRAAENLWTPALIRRTASIYRSLRAVFADALVLPGSTNLVLAADVPLVRRPEVLATRWQDRRIEARLVSPEYIRYLLTNDRRQKIADLLQQAQVPENADARPICYQYTLLLWLSRFFPLLGLADLPNPEPSWGIAAAVAWSLVLGLCRRSAAGRRLLVVTTAGFAGMIFESALILGYQVRQGVLFQDLGLLITMFMAGLSLGAFGLERWIRSTLPGPGIGAGLIGAGAGLSLLVAWSLTTGQSTLPAISSLLLLAGLLVGALFAYATRWEVKDQAAAISPLYAADLLGGCAGSLVGSLFLLPVLGLPGAALVVGGGILALLLLL